MIHQGEQYSLPFKITDGSGTVITPSNCTDVRIKLGSTLKEYSKSQITYNSSKKTWLYSITEAETKALTYDIPFEVSVKFTDGSIVKTTVQWINIAGTIIKEDWTTNG